MRGSQASSSAQNPNKHPPEDPLKQEPLPLHLNCETGCTRFLRAHTHTHTHTHLNAHTPPTHTTSTGATHTPTQQQDRTAQTAPGQPRAAQNRRGPWVMCHQKHDRGGGGARRVPPCPNCGDAYEGELAPIPNPETDGGHYVHGLPPPHQLRPSSHKPANSMKLRPGQAVICGPAEASGQNHQHQVHRHQQGPPLSQHLPPRGEGGDRQPPSPSPSPSPQQHVPPPPFIPQDDEHGEPRGTWAGGKGNTRGGNRAGQTAPAENGAERRRRQRKGQKGKNHCGC